MKKRDIAGGKFDSRYSACTRLILTIDQTEILVVIQEKYR
jgi:hypothetical protein